jgi:hypothetical protein
MGNVVVGGEEAQHEEVAAVVVEGGVVGVPLRRTTTRARYWTFVQN